MTVIRCVGAVVFDAEHRLLLIQRGHDPGRGLWSIPGGRVEAGETDAEAVVREMAEETGLTVVPGQLCGTVHRPAPRGTLLINDYFCTVSAGTAVAGSDADALCWADRATFDELDRTGLVVDLLAETLRDWNALPD
jgi:ADP-ribose pyrophosphatase YjhB (NUDIX family)